MQNSLPNNYPGKRIGSYEIVKEIGNGAFGKQVYLVKKENVNGTRKFYALKCILKSRFFEANGLVRRLVENEKQILLKLKGCKYVIQLQEYMESMNQVYFVMKYCNGGDLANYLERNPNLKLDELLALIRQIIEGYHQLHINRIIHRDLKPQNILIHENSIIKISDLGLAHQLSNDEDYIDKNYGTLGYKAPEVILGQKYNELADIFSLGVLIYRMIFRKQPFPCKTQQSFIISCRDQNPPPMANIPNDLSSLLASMLEYDAKKRLKWSELYESVVIFPNKQSYKVQHPIDYINGQKDLDQNKRDYENMEKKQEHNPSAELKGVGTKQVLQQQDNSQRPSSHIKEDLANSNVCQYGSLTSKSIVHEAFSPVSNLDGDQRLQQDQNIACKESRALTANLEEAQLGPKKQQSSTEGFNSRVSNLEAAQQFPQNQQSTFQGSKSPVPNIEQSKQGTQNQQSSFQGSKSPASSIETAQQGPQNQQSPFQGSKSPASNLEMSQSRQSTQKKKSAVLESKPPASNIDMDQQGQVSSKPKLEKSKSYNDGSQAEEQVVLMESSQQPFQIFEKFSRKPGLLESLKLYQQQTEPLSFLMRFFFLFLRKLNFSRFEPILTHIILADYFVCKYLQDQFCQLNRMLSLRKNFLNLSEQAFEELYSSQPFQAYRKDVVSTINAVDFSIEYYLQTLDQNQAKVETHVDKNLVDRISLFRTKSSSEQVSEILKELMALMHNKFRDIVKSHQHASTVSAEINKESELLYQNFKKAQYMCHAYQKIISSDSAREDLKSPEDLERMPDNEIDGLLENLERIQ